jgi:hypothetical protein
MANEQRETDKTPYWRTLKASGELNAKYPGGRTNIRYYVKDYENALFDSKR